jgi:glycosyltransferase involved in cell wall biosynthesis
MSEQLFSDKSEEDILKEKLSKGKAAEFSFIIPTFNEEQHLPEVLSAIKQLDEKFTYEILVVDNGSTDATVGIAKSFGAHVLRDPTKTIAGLRNLGAKYAVGKILVFLDGDVIITPQWVEESGNLRTLLKKNNRIVTGSRCGISGNPSWIEKYWFSPMIFGKSNYINSGHLIVDREIFFELGEFNDILVTSEDWDFCMKAKQRGIEIINNPDLYVIHKGYPKTLLQFFRREKWHGIQDASSMRAFLNSRPAIIALTYWITGTFGLFLSIYHKSIFYGMLAIIFNSFICFIATLEMKRRYALNIFFYFLLYHVYLFARGLTLLEKLTGKSLFVRRHR